MAGSSKIIFYLLQDGCTHIYIYTYIHNLFPNISADGEDANLATAKRRREQEFNSCNLNKSLGARPLSPKAFCGCFCKHRESFKTGV